VAEPEAEAPAAVRDEKGRFAPKGVEPQETAEPVPPTEPVDKLPQADYAALKDERRKRQEAEARFQALEQQLQSLQQEPPAPPPSIWEDEQGWQQHFGSQVAQQAALNAKLDKSEMLARQNNADFDEMKARFLEMAQDNPAIVQQALSDPHPWAKAYTVAKNAAKMDELGAVDVADLEAKIEARIRAEMQAQPAAPVAIPTSLADAGTARTGTPAAPTRLTLQDILGR
jgi:hypothetical protein